MDDRINTTLSEWTDAERTGDTHTLAVLLTDDFFGVGPLGFVLPRSAWLNRHHQGLHYQDFELDEVQVHPYDGFALVTARNHARGTYQGRPLPEALRTMLVMTDDSRTGHLASVQLSFIAGTPGAPPMPAPPQTVDRRLDREQDAQTQFLPGSEGGRR